METNYVIVTRIGLTELLEGGMSEIIRDCFLVSIKAFAL